MSISDKAKKFRVKKGKVKVYINGLRKGTGKINKNERNGALVALFDLSKNKDESGRELVLGASDERGVVEAYLDDSYVGKSVKLVVRDIGFEYISIVTTVDKIGLFYAVKLQKNNIIDQKYIEKKHGDISCWQNWDSEREYNKAQKDLQDIVRSIKIKNRIAQIITILIFLICPFVGLRFIGWIGVIIGFILGFISLYFTPKALGITR